jgi:hypothetical protein
MIGHYFRHLSWRFIVPAVGLLLWIISLATPVEVSAQGVVSSTTSSTYTSSTSSIDATVPVTVAVPAPPSLQPIEEHELYSDMLQHFKLVTEVSFGLVTVVVAILGAIGGVAAYFSWKTLRELETYVRKTEADLQAQKGELAKMKDVAEADLRQSKQDLERMKARFENELEVSNRTQQLLWLSMEIRDPSPAVRIRAVQQFGEIDDMISASNLIEVLNKDDDPGVQMEAASGLGRRLNGDGSQGEMYGRGLELMSSKLEGNSVDLKLTVLEAYEAIVNRGFVLPQYIVVKLRNIARGVADPDLASSAQKVLEGINRQRIPGNSAQQFDRPT